MVYRAAFIHSHLLCYSFNSPVHNLLMYSGTDLQDSSQKTHELRFSNQQNHIQVTDKINDCI